MLEIYEFCGKNKGINLLVLGAIHGNETAGPLAIKKILQKLDSKEITLTSGKLTLVPICNPQAYQKNVRQIEENLNRVMKMHKNPKTYEQKLANEICPLIKKSDITLDLHSTHCEGDEPFAFCDYPNEMNQKLISGLNIKYVLEGWPDIYGNNTEIRDFSTEQYAHECGKTGTTLECGYHKSPYATELAYNAIVSTLSKFKMIEPREIAACEKAHILLQKYVIKQKSGNLCHHYKHLDPLKKGEIIARYDDGEELIAEKNCYILLPNQQAEIGAEWYYLGQKISRP